MPRDDGISPQPAVLGLLMSRPKHGYELYQELSRDLGQVWQIGQSQLYAQLKQLEEAGLVQAQVETQSSRPPRKVYHLTPAGRAAFEQWVHQPTPYLRTIRVEFLARLYFFHRLSLPGLERLVAEQKAVCQAQLERFGRMAADIRLKPDSAESDDNFRQCVLEFRRGQMEAVVGWLDRCLQIL
jgi:DNA-binding PadR family transcriptional regulator